jgi:Tol biopolymer transport system component
MKKQLAVVLSALVLFSGMSAVLSPGEAVESFVNGRIVVLVHLPEGGLNSAADSSNRPQNGYETEFRFYDPNGDTIGSLYTGYVDDHPVWSPDGSRIAFASFRGTNTRDVFVMDDNGDNPINLTNHPDSDDEPAWSPDGSMITFVSSRDGDSEIYVMGADGSGQTNISNNPPSGSNATGIDVGPVWSPDGSKIAFVSLRSGNNEIYVMNPDGSGVVNLTNSARDEHDPTWSPDGSHIAYVVGWGDDADIWTMRSDGTEQTNVTNDAVLQWDPVWSPDGSMIAFRMFDGIWTIAPDGSGLSELIWIPDVLAIQSFDWERLDAGSYGSITGTITDDGSVPVDSGRVDLVDEFGSHVRSVYADASGFYSTGPVPNGTYSVLMYNGDAVYFWGYFPEWYDDAPLFRDDLATQVTVDGGVVTGVDAMLMPFFDDMWDTVFTDDIFWMQAIGASNGCGDNLYCVDDPVPREIMADQMAKALQLPPVPAGWDPFVDDDGNPYEDSIERMAQAGVTYGCNPPTNNMYCPDRILNRGEMAAFFVRALDLTDDGGGDLFIDDDDSVFRGDADCLGAAGISYGCNPPDNTMFCPNRILTRGEIAAFIHRALRGVMWPFGGSPDSVPSAGTAGLLER